ncbi:hypothetical protein [Rhodococcus opacus]|uniref:Uncharacterized protein n=1 Tax=Rhodococcus opacus (strain B4) TaxID=632772 RepID=C1AWB3_RHOOB|nr:hypothetical protein [Rhodococcus opacus]BAH53686.1 hypothetical protein ROP_54390 [Rhodococcus opacus B4]
MTTETSEKYNPGEVDLAETRDWFGSPDLQLQKLAFSANRMGWGIGVTLYLPWGVVTGITAPDAEFFRHSDEEIRERMASNEGAIDVADNYLSPVADTIKARHSQAYSDDELQEVLERTTYLTIKDAQCSLQNAPATIATNNRHFRHAYLRLRLSQVTGWALENVSLDL